MTWTFWGWNHLRVLSLICLTPGLGWFGNWAQWEFFTGTPICGFSTWQGLPSVWWLVSKMNCPKKSKRTRQRRCLAFSGSASEILLCLFCCPIWVKGVKNPLRFKTRRSRSWLSVGGVSVNLHLFLKTAALHYHTWARLWPCWVEQRTGKYITNLLH